MHNKKENRRHFLKNSLATSVVAGGVAASGDWVKPAVKSVMLPTHAATSMESFAVSFNGLPLIIGSNDVQRQDTLLSQLLDHAVESAHAENSSFTTEIVILPLGGISYNLQMLITGFDGATFEYGYFSGVLAAGAEFPTSIQGEQCRVGSSGPPCGNSFIQFVDFQLISVTPGVSALVSIDNNPPELVPFVPNPNTLSDPCTTCEPLNTL